MGPRTMVLKEECLLQDAGGLTTGECALKRLAPQPVVSLRPPASQRTGNGEREYPGTWFRSPDVSPLHGRHPQSGQICTIPRAGESSTPQPLSLVHSLASPYFSSSLTLSTRGAVSPARHIPIGPRPHPDSGDGGEVLFETITGNRGCDPAALSGRGIHVSHSPAPWQSRGRAGMLSCRARIPKVVA
jgi:hypothetical protein